MYRITLRNNAAKFLKKLSRDQYRRFSNALYALAENPLSGDVKKLRGDIPGAYRLRVGKWRVLFMRNDDTRVLDIIVIEKRGDVY